MALPVHSSLERIARAYNKRLGDYGIDRYVLDSAHRENNFEIVYEAWNITDKIERKRFAGMVYHYFGERHQGIILLFAFANWRNRINNT